MTRHQREITDDDEYDAFITQLPSAEERVMLALRESRYVTGFFPPYSSGATGMITDLLAELKEEWTSKTS